MGSISITKKYRLKPIGSKGEVILMKQNFLRCANAYNGLNEGTRRMIEINLFLWKRFMKKNGLLQESKPQSPIATSEKKRKKLHEKRHKENRKRRQISKWSITYKRAVRRAIGNAMTDLGYKGILIPIPKTEHKFIRIDWGRVISKSAKFIKQDPIIKKDEVLNKMTALCWSSSRSDLSRSLKLQKTQKDSGARSKLKSKLFAKTLTFDVNDNWTIDEYKYQTPLPKGKIPQIPFKAMKPISERALKNKFFHTPDQIRNNGILNIPWIGSFEIVGWNSKQYGLPRRFWGCLRTMKLSLVEDGHAHKYLDYKGNRRRGITSNFYTSLSVELYGIAKKERSNIIIGIDCGIRYIAYLSDGSCYINPYWEGWQKDENNLRLSPEEKSLVSVAKKKNRKLLTAYRKLSRCKIGSMNRMKRRATLKKFFREKSNFIEDYHNKIIISIAKKNPDFLKMENLKIKNMLKSAEGTEEEHGVNVAQKRGLNRSMKDASIGNFQQKLAHFLLRCGIKVVWVNPEYTSQECSSCGEKNKSNRLYGGENFLCVSCKHEMHADNNAAINISRKSGKIKNELTEYEVDTGSPYARSGV